jgi:N-acetylglucosamine-6-sulfatase
LIVTARSQSLTPERRFDGLVANIDIAPTLAGSRWRVPAAIKWTGMSVWSALCSNDATMLQVPRIAVRVLLGTQLPAYADAAQRSSAADTSTSDATGLWDRDELYDLQTDPNEMNNLIDAPQHAERVKLLNTRLWKLIQDSGGDDMPLLIDHGPVFPMRDPDASEQAPFPAEYFAR